MGTATATAAKETTEEGSASERSAPGRPRRKGASGTSSKKGKRGLASKELGRRGEEAAARFLVHRGYDILERNWTCFAGEADIIARDGSTIVFVEVKTRSDAHLGFPSEAITPAKRERYEKIACAYLQECDCVDVMVRFDAVSLVVIDEGKALVRHHINAWGEADR